MKFLDALYGRISLDISQKLLCLPELQRLREVRLCNVNSPYITGGTNLNRFEHAIGTAYLSKLFCESHNLSKYKDEFFVASLLHDIVTGPFGHSLEYLFDALNKKVYEHAQLDTIFKGKTVQSSRAYYMGKKSILIHRNDIIDINNVRNILLGTHNLSKFLANNIDLDNIDNVFRFAYHIGIKFDSKTPEALSRELAYKDDMLIFTKNNIPLYAEWYETRKLLYKFLLEDPGEFVAKAILERTFIELIKAEIINEYDWILSDSDLVRKALDSGNKQAKECIQKYMLMDFPKYNGIFYTNSFQKVDKLLQKNKIKLIESASKDGVFLHFIRDVNKTQRPLTGINYQDKILTIGENNDRYLIGCFSDTKKLIGIIKKNFESILGEELISIDNDNDTQKTEPSLF